jgi:hypothetical protein
MGSGEARLRGPLMLTMQGSGQHEPSFRLDLHDISFWSKAAYSSGQSWGVKSAGKGQPAHNPLFC